MSNRELIVAELERIPEPLLEEVLHFLRSVRAKGAGGVPETASASESVLGRDWLRPEEDDAWRGL